MAFIEHYPIAYILAKVLQKCSLKVLYLAYELCPTRWIWLVAMATERLNLRGGGSEIFSSEAITGMKLKLCRNIHNINLYKNYVFVDVAYVLWLLWHWLVMGKNENWQLLLSYIDILAKKLSEMFTEWSSTKHIILVQTPLFHLWSWQPKTKFV